MLFFFWIIEKKEFLLGIPEIFPVINGNFHGKDAAGWHFINMHLAG